MKRKKKFRVDQYFFIESIRNDLLTSSVTWFAFICNSSSSVRGGPATSACGGAGEGISIQNNRRKKRKFNIIQFIRI